jgi:hypothetical protein
MLIHSLAAVPAPAHESNLLEPIELTLAWPERGRPVNLSAVEAFADQPLPSIIDQVCSNLLAISRQVGLGSIDELTFLRLEWLSYDGLVRLEFENFADDFAERERNGLCDQVRGRLRCALAARPPRRQLIHYGDLGRS